MVAISKPEEPSGNQKNTALDPCYVPTSNSSSLIYALVEPIKTLSVDANRKQHQKNCIISQMNRDRNRCVVASILSALDGIRSALFTRR